MRWSLPVSTRNGATVSWLHDAWEQIDTHSWICSTLRWTLMIRTAWERDDVALSLVSAVVLLRQPCSYASRNFAIDEIGSWTPWERERERRVESEKERERKAVPLQVLGWWYCAWRLREREDLDPLVRANRRSSRCISRGTKSLWSVTELNRSGTSSYDMIEQKRSYREEEIYPWSRRTGMEFARLYVPRPPSAV